MSIQGSKLHMHRSHPHQSIRDSTAKDNSTRGTNRAKAPSCTNSTRANRAKAASTNSTRTRARTNPGANQESAKGSTLSDTRHLIAAWAEVYPNIGKQRNSKEWESVASNLNKALAENVIKIYRSGDQCKSKMKNLIDAYKVAKDHNSRSGVENKDSQTSRSWIKC